MFSSPYIRKTCITWEQYSSIVSVWVYVRRKVCVCVCVLVVWKKRMSEREKGKVHTVHTITELECWPLLLSSTFTVPVDMNHYQQRNCTYTPSPPAHPPLHIQQEHTGLLKYHSMSYIHLQLQHTLIFYAQRWSVKFLTTNSTKHNCKSICMQ